MTNLVERLRYPIHSESPDSPTWQISGYAECRTVMDEAANEIERLYKIINPMRMETLRNGP